MHRAEPKAGGYLGDIQLSLPYEPAGGVYLHAAEMVQHTAACFRSEYALQLCPADKVIPAYLLDGKGLVKALLKVLYYFPCALGGRGAPWGRSAAPAYEPYQQLLQGGLQQLLAAKGNIIIALHGVCGGVIEGSGKYGVAFADYAGKQHTLLRTQ